MSEGELKKRIKSGTSVSGILWIADLYNIQKIIDEVAKEFPNADAMDDIVTWHPQVDTWFKKWFGDAP